MNSIKRTLEPHDVEFIYFMDAKDLDVAKGMKNKPRVADQSPGVYILGVKDKVTLANVHAQEKLIFTMFSLLFGIFLLFIFGLVFLINKSVVASIKTIAEGMKDIAQGEGNLTKRLTAVSRYEIGQLSREFKTFIEKLDKLIWDVNDRNQRLGLVSNELSGVSALMTTNAGKVFNQANKVSSAAEKMSSNMNTVAAEVGQVTVNANHIAAATEEKTASISEIAENTGKTRQITDQAVKDAGSASDKIGDLRTSQGWES